MKFQFTLQQYQTDAVEAVTSVFRGQGYYDKVNYVIDLGKKDTQLKALTPAEEYGEFEQESTGYKNESIELTDVQILENIRLVQLQNNIKQSSELIRDLGRCSLDIEMETGTGKTYVYIKTMFELNKRYGWSKFIVVVPSIAIREGVKKSFEMTQDHFMEHYGKKARFFIYNSTDLQPVDDFSSGSGINVMIINTQAFATSLNEEKSKEGRGGDATARIIYSKRDEFGSRRPIDVIRANRPIVILDEPQKMGGEVTRKALKNFNPLFTLNYSATHAIEHNLIYVLDALDAYNKRLVKKIEVKGFEVKNLQGTNHYLYFEKIVLSSKRPPMAKMEIEIARKQEIGREARILGVGDNLFYLSNEMEQYKGFIVNGIDPFTGKVTFLNGVEIATGEVIGNVSEDDMRRIQIRETIASHFEKEEQLYRRGIKTLSLFFIDEVAKYRQYDENGEEALGEYGKVFEQEYLDVLNQYLKLDTTPYQKYLREVCSIPGEVHRGYFSIDKRTGRSVNSELKRGSESSDDISAYDLILKNKERLLSFEEPTRFIFSHSALREGWDNPNVFQICTLKYGNSETMKRQEVGRGLRLCVNQEGTRMDAEACGDTIHDINKLTVVASESYKSFVEDLQKDILAVLYERPVKATKEYFEGKTIRVGEQLILIDAKKANEIHRYLIKHDYIDDEDKVTDTYRVDLANGNLALLPADLQSISEGVHTLVQAIFDETVLVDMFENANATKVIDNELNDNFYKQEFQTLWGYINRKYAYTVEFDSSELIRKAIDHINDKLFVSELKYTTTTGVQQDVLDEYKIKNQEGFVAIETSNQTMKNARKSQIKYDLIGKVAEGTTLTRRTVAAILKGLRPAKFNMFQINPEEFISKVIRLIKEQKSTMIVEHISYNQSEGAYDSTIFTAEKPAQTLDKAFRAKKHIRDYVFTDGISNENKEMNFAKDLDVAREVCVYAKLPRGFSIPTPVGNYSPDWAIAFNQDSVKHICFIAETKGSMDSMNIRPIEQAKIACAKKLFNEISTSQVKYHDVDSYQTLLSIMSSL